MINTRKQVIALAMAAVLGLQSTAVLANTPATPRHPIMSAGYPMMVQAGNYNIENYNRSDLQKRYLDILQANQQADRDLILNTVAEAEQSFSMFLQQNVVGGIEALSDQSIAAGSGGIDVATFLSAVRKYKAAVLAVENSIKGIESIPQMIQKARTEDAMGGQVSNPLNVDFTPLADHYKNQLEKIKDSIEQAQFKLNLGTQYGIRYFSLENVDELKKMKLLTIQEIDSMRQEASKLENPKSKNYKSYKMVVFGAYSTHFDKLINSFIQSYGKSQRYRDQVNDQGLKDTIQRLEEAFWTRSFFRAAYGLPLGTFKINWKKRWFNFDWLNKNQIDFQGATTDQADMVTQYDNAINALAAISKKNGRDIDGEVSISSRIASTLTWLAGSTQTAYVNTVVLTLVAADIKEEMMLGDIGGRRKVFTSYVTRFKSTDEDKAHYATVKQNIVGDPTESDDPFADVRTSGNDDIKGLFRKVQDRLENVQDGLERARDLRAQIEMLTQDNKSRKQTKSAMDFL